MLGLKLHKFDFIWDSALLSDSDLKFIHSFALFKCSARISLAGENRVKRENVPAERKAYNQTQSQMCLSVLMERFKLNSDQRTAVKWVRQQIESKVRDDTENTDWLRQSGAENASKQESSRKPQEEEEEEDTAKERQHTTGLYVGKQRLTLILMASLSSVEILLVYMCRLISNKKLQNRKAFRLQNEKLFCGLDWSDSTKSILEDEESMKPKRWIGQWFLNYHRQTDF